TRPDPDRRDDRGWRSGIICPSQRREDCGLIPGKEKILQRSIFRNVCRGMLIRRHLTYRALPNVQQPCGRTGLWFRAPEGDSAHSLARAEERSHCPWPHAPRKRNRNDRDSAYLRHPSEGRGKQRQSVKTLLAALSDQDRAPGPDRVLLPG